MPSAQVLPPFEMFMDVDGSPLEDGYIYVGADNLDPESNQIPAFFDELLTVPATQPVRTKGGFPSNSGAPSRIYVGPTSYSIRVKNKNGTPIHSDLSITSSSDSSVITFVQAGTGAAPRPLQEKVREQPITIEDFLPNIVYVEAPYGQAEVSLATIVDDALEAAMQTAVAQGRKVALRGKVYRITRSFVPISLSHVSGVGCGQWLATMDPSIAGGVYKPDMKGSILLATGTGPKVHTVLGVTDCRTSGGVVPNDNIINPGYDDSYKLFSGYNEDANFTTGAAATPKLFSAAVKLNRGVHGLTFENFRIMKSFKGIEGYHTAEIGYGDDWDFGLYGDNATDNKFINIQVAGYWQEAGRMFRVGVVGGEGSAETASIENNLFEKSTFQGLSGSEIRGQDYHRVIGRGADFIDLPWAANHPFDPTLLAGRIRSSTGTSYTFAGVSVVAGNLRLTGVSPSPAALSLSAGIIPNLMANGMAKFTDPHCSFTGMDHQSGNRVTATEMGAFRKTRPSSAFNMSGYTLRGYSAPGCKITSQDDVGYQIHQATDTYLGPRFEIESKDANGLGLGLRLITSPSEGNNTRVANPSGQTFRFKEDTMRNTSDADHRPIGALAPPRFPLGNGYLQYNTGIISSVYDPLDNGRFIAPPVGGSAGVKRSDGGLAGYYDDLAGQYRFAKDVRFDTNLLLNSNGSTKLVLTGSSTGIRGDIITLSSADAATTFIRVASTEMRAGTHNTVDLGTSAIKFKDAYSIRYFIGNANTVQSEGTGTPEGLITAPVGSTYQRRDGGAATSFYVKESGTGNTGWVAK